jgi:hypothetical protein
VSSDEIVESHYEPDSRRNICRNSSQCNFSPHTQYSRPRGTASQIQSQQNLTDMVWDSLQPSNDGHIVLNDLGTNPINDLNRVEVVPFPFILNIPSPDAHTYPLLHSLLQLVQGLHLRSHIKKVLMLAQNLARFCPWMLTLEVTDEWSLAFYVSDSRNEDILFDELRMQPHTFGYYLRAILWAGYGGMIFNTLSLITFPSEILSNLDTIHQYLICLVHSYLIVQLLLNALLLTPRLIVHLQCWTCSHIVETEASLDSLKMLLRSDVWRAGRLLGRVQDGVTMLFLFLSQIALFYLQHTMSNNNQIRTFDVLIELFFSP